MTAFQRQCDKANFARREGLQFTLLELLGGLVGVLLYCKDGYSRSVGLLVIVDIFLMGMLLVGVFLVPLRHAYWTHVMKQHKDYWRQREKHVDEKYGHTLWPLRWDWWVMPFWDVAFARRYNQAHGDSQPLEQELARMRLFYIGWLVAPLLAVIVLTLLL